MENSRLLISPCTLLTRLALLMAASCLWACGPEQFDEEEPYALEVGRYRKGYQLSVAQELIKEMGIPSYHVSTLDEEEGMWHLLLHGKFGRLESAMAERIRLEDQFRFNSLQIVNYNGLKNKITDQDLTSPSMKKQDYLLDSWMADLLEELPFSAEFQPEEVQLISRADSLNVMRIPEIRSAYFDMPRGIDPKRWLPRSQAFVEAHFYDRMTKDEVVLHAMQLDTAGLGIASLAEYFSKEILKTRQYTFEEEIPISYKGKNNTWEGFEINLEPRQNVIARYRVLVDKTGSRLLFLQSLSAGKATIDRLASTAGNVKGMLSYQSLHRSFSHLPPNTTFTYLKYRQLQDVQGSLASLLEGTYKSEFLFQDDGRYWSLNVNELSDPESAERIFKRFFMPRRNTADSLLLNKEPAFYLTRRERNPVSGGFAPFTDEIRQLSGNRILIFKAGRASAYNREEVLSLLEGKPVM